MELFIHVATILFGFVLGYFFTTAVVTIFTIIVCIAAVVLRPQQKYEIAALIGIMAWYILGLGTIVMWATHLYVTDADLGLSEILKYIIRK